MEAVIAGNTIHCFVNGVRFLSYTDADILGGVAYGIRAGATGVNYTENDTTGKHAVILESTDVTFMLVADGEAAQKPVDPVKQGFVFDDWYVGNSETPYDWTTPVTSDITVTAKFTEDNTADYTLTQGTVENSDYGIKTTKAETLVIMRNTTFTQGALEVKFKPTTKNDCGLVFGANVTTDAKWENFDYFTVLLNKNGTVLVARVNSWGVMASSAIVEGNFNPANEYAVKVVYKSGYARVFVNNLLAATVYIGELKGSAVGFRAESVGTEFSDNVTVDAAVTLDIGQAETDVTFIKRAGTQEMTVDNGTYTSTANGTMYTSDNKILVRGGSVSVKINVSGAADKTQCNGIIFGVPSNSTSGDLWENSGDNYYFFFISDDGNVRFNTLSPWGVENDKGFFKVNTQKIDTSVEHTLTVSWDGNGVVCFVDGTMYFCADSVKYNGGVFGMRVQTAGVVYKDFTVVSYAESATTVATDA